MLTLVHKCIDLYTEKRVALYEKKEENVVIDTRMEAIVNRKFEQCFVENKFKQAIGIALETRRIDMVQNSILRSDNPEMMLGYAFTLATDTIKSQEFRTDVLKTILEVYKTRQAAGGDDRDYYKIAKCMFHLDLPENTAELLEKLITSEKEDEYLVAY